MKTPGHVIAAAFVLALDVGAGHVAEAKGPAPRCTVLEQDAMVPSRVGPLPIRRGPICYEGRHQQDEGHPDRLMSGVLATAVVNGGVLIPAGTKVAFRFSGGDGMELSRDGGFAFGGVPLLSPVSLMSGAAQLDNLADTQVRVCVDGALGEALSLGGFPLAAGRDVGVCGSPAQLAGDDRAVLELTHGTIGRDGPICLRPGMPCWPLRAGDDVQTWERRIGDRPQLRVQFEGVRKVVGRDGPLYARARVTFDRETGHVLEMTPDRAVTLNGVPVPAAPENNTHYEVQLHPNGLPLEVLAAQPVEVGGWLVGYDLERKVYERRDDGRLVGTYHIGPSDRMRFWEDGRLQCAISLDPRFLAVDVGGRRATAAWARVYFDRRGDPRVVELKGPEDPALKRLEVRGQGDRLAFTPLHEGHPMWLRRSSSMDCEDLHGPYHAKALRWLGEVGPRQ